MTKVSHSTAKYCAITSAILTFINAAIIAATIKKTSDEWDSDDHDCDIEKFKLLETACVELNWKIENDVRWHVFSINIIGAIAPILFIPLVMTYADIFSKTGSSLVRLMLPCFIFAAGVQAFQAASEAGLHTVADWIDREFALEYPGEVLLKSLTLTFFVSRSMFLWVFAMDLLFLAIGMFSIGLLALKGNDLPRAWGVIACVSGFLGFVSFCFELARFGNWQLFSMLSAFIILLNLFVLTPIWLIWGGCLLSRFESTGNREGLMVQDAEESAALEMTPVGDVSRL